MTEIQPTFKLALRVWWAYLWRNLLMLLGGMILGALVGGVLGFILGALGASVRTVQLVCGPIGLVIGLGLSILPIYWILGKDFGSFRLVLVSKTGDESPRTPPLPLARDY